MRTARRLILAPRFAIHFGSGKCSNGVNRNVEASYEYASRLKIIFKRYPRGRAIPVDLEIVCLWSVIGLTLTALFLALGFWVDIVQALILAG